MERFGTFHVHFWLKRSHAYEQNGPDHYHLLWHASSTALLLSAYDLVSLLVKQSQRRSHTRRQALCPQIEALTITVYGSES
jgi:hypothetical protein